MNIFDLIHIDVDWFWLGSGLLLGALLGWRSVMLVAAIGGYLLGKQDKRRKR